MAGILALAALMMAFTPSSLLELLGVVEKWEVDLLRFASLFLFGQAALVARMARKKISDDRWGLVILAGDVAAAFAVVYLTTGHPLFLVLAFAMLMAIMLRTLMPVLDHWSAEARARFEHGR